MRRLRICALIAFGCLLGYIGAVVAFTYAQVTPVPPPPLVGKAPFPAPGSPGPGVGPVVSPPPKGEQPSDWAAPAWRWAIARRIVDGREPKKPCTREMAITWLYRFSQQQSAQLAEMERVLERQRERREQEREETPFIPSSAPDTPSPSGLVVSELTCYRTPLGEENLSDFPFRVPTVRVVGKIKNAGSEEVGLHGDVVGIEGYDKDGRLLVAEVLSTRPPAPPAFSVVPHEATSGKPQIGPALIPPAGYATFQTAILAAPSVASVTVRVLQ